MFLWLLVSSVSSYPIVSSNFSDSIQNLLLNSTDFDNTTVFFNSTEKPTNYLDLSKLITLRKYDWRDAHEEKMIIWSLESQYHPEFGKIFSKTRKNNSEQNRNEKSSKLMSFIILGSVIGFILYTYLSHVVMMRKINEQQKAAQLRELLERSAMIMAGSAQQSHLTSGMGERRRSLINLFSHFKL